MRMGRVLRCLCNTEQGAGYIDPRSYPRTPFQPLGGDSNCKTSAFVQAEVQALYQDGSVALHTRSTKYGKVGPHCLLPSPFVTIY